MQYTVIEPFPALFLQKVTKPAGLASLNPGTGTVRQGSVRFNLTEEVSPPTHFLSSCTYSMVYLIKFETLENSQNVDENNVEWFDTIGEPPPPPT